MRWIESPERSRLEELAITARFYLPRLAFASLANIVLAIFLDILAVRGVPRERLTSHEMRLE
jgi:hypothetical protein